MFGRQVGDKRPGERLALALSELGPAFIKFGQVLSTRSDLLGEQVAEDLAKLQDQLPAFSAFQARATIEAELGARIEELYRAVRRRAGFRRLDQPGAFRRSRVPDEEWPEGRQVAVKVLRPGIEEAFQRRHRTAAVAGGADRAHAAAPEAPEAGRGGADLRRHRAAWKWICASRPRRPRSCGRISPAIPTYRVPEIDWRRTAKRAMTQERLTGIPMDDRAGMLAAGLDVDDVLAKAAAAFFNQAFRDGYFHGDQHPGNMTVGYDGAIQVVDFGIMGRLTKRTRYFLADMLLAFLQRDYAKVAEVYVDAGYLPPVKSVEDFTLALRSIGEPIHGRPLQRHLVRARARPAVRRRRELRDGSAAGAAAAAEEHADGRGRQPPPQSRASTSGPWRSR